MQLVEQWRKLQGALPDGWESARLTVTPENPQELARAAAVLGPMSPGRGDGMLVLEVRRAAGPAGPAAAERLFGRLDADRVWCTLAAEGEAALSAAPPREEPLAAGAAAASWDDALAALPEDWSDVLAELELDGTALLERAALLCAPMNPTREHGSAAFTFRCARRAGYGVSPGVARRCLEALDSERIPARTRVLRMLADTGNVGTQGPVWYVGDRVL